MKIKHCPFCGGEAKLIDDDYSYVICTKCDIHPYHKISIKYAIALWNTRTSKWNTGVPMEEGWYVCKLANSKLYETHNFTGNNWNEELFEKWQKLEE